MGVPWVIIALVVGGVLVCVVAAMVVIMRQRRAAEPTPRCGNCGYNLTGAPSNRCPECGKLFVEAGVITQAAEAPRPKPQAWVSLAVMAVVLLLVFYGVLRGCVARRGGPLPATAPISAMQLPGDAEE